MRSHTHIFVFPSSCFGVGFCAQSHEGGIQRVVNHRLIRGLSTVCPRDDGCSPFLSWTMDRRLLVFINPFHVKGKKESCPLREPTCQRPGPARRGRASRHDMRRPAPNHPWCSWVWVVESKTQAYHGRVGAEQDWTPACRCAHETADPIVRKHEQTKSYANRWRNTTSGLTTGRWPLFVPGC